VVDVANNITVLDTWTWKTDLEIKENIESKLFWSSLVDSDDISVSVEDGAATIKGDVDNLKEYREVIKDAFEGGARAVKSRLKIDDYDFKYEGFFHYPPNMAENRAGIDNKRTSREDRSNILLSSISISIGNKRGDDLIAQQGFLQERRI
jgi:hypothetical protein